MCGLKLVEERIFFCLIDVFPLHEKIKAGKTIFNYTLSDSCIES